MNYQEILVECAKKNGLHQIDGMDFWIKTGNLLFIIEDRWLNSKERTWACSFKPLYSDELLWRISEIGGRSVETWEDFRKKGTSRRVDGVFVAPAKLISSCSYELASTEEAIRLVYENKIREFLEITETTDETEYETEKTVSMINILRAIHEKDYEKARELTKKIHIWGENTRPEDEVLWHDDYRQMRRDILNFLKKLQAL